MAPPQDGRRRSVHADAVLEPHTAHENWRPLDPDRKNRSHCLDFDLMAMETRDEVKPLLLSNEERRPDTYSSNSTLLEKVFKAPPLRSKHQQRPGYDQRFVYPEQFKLETARR